MTCRAVRVPGGAAIVCSLEPRPAPCMIPGCGRPHTKLCDFPVTRRGKTTTCDVKICDTHAISAGTDRDHCPAHAKAPAPAPGPSVINRHHFRWEPGFGEEPDRAGAVDRRPSLPSPRLYIGRGTPLGNPYTKPEHGTRALSLYRRWLFEKVRASDRLVLAELASITAAHHLVCSCAPKPCHGDVIVSCWRWALEAGILRP